MLYFAQVGGKLPLTITSEWANAGLTFLSLCMTLFIFLAGFAIKYLSEISKNQASMLLEMKSIGQTANMVKDDLHSVKGELDGAKNEIHSINVRVAVLERNQK